MESGSPASTCIHEWRGDKAGSNAKSVPAEHAFQLDDVSQFFSFNQKNSSMFCIGVNKIKFHFDTSQLCCGVVHYHLA